MATQFYPAPAERNGLQPLRPGDRTVIVEYGDGQRLAWWGMDSGQMHDVRVRAQDLRPDQFIRTIESVPCRQHSTGHLCVVCGMGYR